MGGRCRGSGWQSSPCRALVCKCRHSAPSLSTETGLADYLSLNSNNSDDGQDDDRTCTLPLYSNLNVQYSSLGLYFIDIICPHRLKFKNKQQKTKAHTYLVPQHRYSGARWWEPRVCRHWSESFQSDGPGPRRCCRGKLRPRRAGGTWKNVAFSGCCCLVGKGVLNHHSIQNKNPLATEEYLFPRLFRPHLSKSTLYSC